MRQDKDGHVPHLLLSSDALTLPGPQGARNLFIGEPFPGSQAAFCWGALPGAFALTGARP